MHQIQELFLYFNQLMVSTYRFISKRSYALIAWHPSIINGNNDHLTDVIEVMQRRQACSKLDPATCGQPNRRGYWPRNYCKYAHIKKVCPSMCGTCQSKKYYLNVFKFVECLDDL